MADPVLEALKGGGASSASLDADARTLTIPAAISGGGDAITSDIAAKHAIATTGGTDKSYALGALYLCLAKPDQTYVAYRKECRELGVEAVKVTDRKEILEYFGGAAGGAAAGDAADDGSAAAAPAEEAAADQKDDAAAADQERKRGGKDGKKRGDGGKRKSETPEERKARKAREKEEADRRRREKDEAAARLRAQKKERAKTGMTNEQLMEGLDVVVDKRDEDDVDGGGDAAAGVVPGGKTTGLMDEDGGGMAAAGTSAAPTPAALSEEEREEEEERRQHALVIQSLSSAGFEVGGMADAIEADRKAVEAIAAMEIPVGNSASVLRCGAGSGDAQRDFSRVLELYTESLKAEERAKRAAAAAAGGGGPPGSDRKRSSAGGGGGDGGRWGPKRAKGGSGDAGSSSKSGGRTTPPRPKATGPPIIVVPNAMTSPITLINATDFLRDATFVPRDVALKKAGGNSSLAQLRKGNVMVRHKVAARLGGREIDFEIVDNPTSRLQNPADWDRVVAVIAQGAEWQFKGWRHSRPVDLFGRCFGFYIGIEGAPIPKELQGWNVKLGKLNRDKRGLDSVTFASFWNGLSEWMHVNKPEYLKQDEGA